MLGSVHAAKSLGYLLQTNRIGRFQRRGCLEEHLVVLNMFLVQKKPSTRLAEAADYFYEGLEVDGHKMERFQNALSLYKASKTIKGDSYTDFSIAMMTENGEGIPTNLSSALIHYWTIMEQSLNGNRGGVFLPCLLRIGLIYAKATLRFLSFGLYFDQYEL